MTTTFRAIVALALLLGFYLLVALVIIAAVAIDILALKTFNAGAIKVALLVSLAALALGRALFVVGGGKGPDDYGFVVTPQQEPVLWQEINALSAYVGTAPPDEIRIVPDVNAAVAEETALLGLRSKRRRMFIGFPLLATLTAAELRAVLGHELGHYSGSHTRLGAPTYRGRVALIRAIQGLGNHPLIARIFVAYAKIYFRISLAVSRRQELEADEGAVRISGKAATAEALRKIHAAGGAWAHYQGSYLALIGPAKALPRDLFGGFRSLLAAQSERFVAEAAAEEHSAYDSHPSLAERLSAISRLPEARAVRDDRPASVLLRDPVATEQAVAAGIWTDEAKQLPAASWDDIIARGMYQATGAEAVSDLLVAAQRITGAQVPMLGSALDVLAAGDHQRFARELRTLGWQGRPNDRDLLVTVLTGAVQGILVEAGRARWALSWTGPAVLIDAQGTAIEGIKDLAARVVDDPRRVPDLAGFFTHYGIAFDHRPARAAASLS